MPMIWLDLKEAGDFLFPPAVKKVSQSRPRVSAGRGDPSWPGAAPPPARAWTPDFSARPSSSFPTHPAFFGGRRGGPLIGGRALEEAPDPPPMHPPPGIPGWSPSLSSLQPGEPLYRGYTRPGHSTVVRATDCLAQATQARFEPRDRVLWLP